MHRIGCDSTQMVYDMGYVMTEAELVAAAAQLDQNGDGKITYDEFAVCSHLTQLLCACVCVCVSI